MSRSSAVLSLSFMVVAVLGALVLRAAGAGAVALPLAVAGALLVAFGAAVLTWDARRTRRFA
jgi:uncharacterized membrane protein